MSKASVRLLGVLTEGVRYALWYGLVRNPVVSVGAYRIKFCQSEEGSSGGVFWILYEYEGVWVNWGEPWRALSRGNLEAVFTEAKLFLPWEFLDVPEGLCFRLRMASWKSAWTIRPAPEGWLVKGNWSGLFLSLAGAVRYVEDEARKVGVVPWPMQLWQWAEIRS